MRANLDENVFNLNKISNIIPITDASSFDEVLIKYSQYKWDNPFYINLDYNEPFILIDKSIDNFNSKNHFFNLIDTSVVWYEYPAINYSLFFYNSLKHLPTTKGNIYRVLPFFNTDIVRSSHIQFDISFNYLTEKGINIDNFNIFFSDFYNQIFDEKLIYNSFEEFQQKMSVFEDIIEYRSKINKLDTFFIKEIFNKFIFDKNTDLDFIDYLVKEIANPKKDHFQIFKQGCTYKKTTSQKFWSKGKFLLIQEKLCRNI